MHVRVCMHIHIYAYVWIRSDAMWTHVWKWQEYLTVVHSHKNPRKNKILSVYVRLYSAVKFWEGGDFGLVAAYSVWITCVCNHTLLSIPLVKHHKRQRSLIFSKSGHACKSHICVVSVETICVYDKTALKLNIAPWYMIVCTCVYASMYGYATFMSRVGCVRILLTVWVAFERSNQKPVVHKLVQY
jgi:hypothetical protein